MPNRTWLRRRRRFGSDDLSFGPRSSALRNPEREVHYFRLRVLVAMAFVIGCFALLGARFAWLQVLKHDDYLAQAELNRIAVLAGHAEPRPDQGPARPHHRPQLFGLYARGHALQGGGPRPDDRSAGAGRRHTAARSASFPQAPGGHEALRHRADPDAPQRRGSGALHRPALPLPWRGPACTSLPRLPAGADRVAHAGLHRPHLAARPRAHREDERSSRLSRHGAHRETGHRAELRARAARRHRRGGSRDHGRWTRRAHAEACCADAGQQPHVVGRHRTAACGRAGLRRPPRRADRDRAKVR